MRVRAPAGAVVCVLGVVLACNKQASEPQATETETELSLPPYHADLGRHFEAATAGLDITAAEVQAPALAWAPPACQLRYEFRVRQGMRHEPENSLPTVGLAMDGSWVALADGQRMILRSGELLVSSMQDGARLPDSEGVGKLAEIRLETDGRRWTEVDGPTMLWSAFGLWYGLTIFYPPVPESTAVGATIDWPLRIHLRGEPLAAEVERGDEQLEPGTEIEPPEATTLAGRVELVRWIELGGRRAAVLRARLQEYSAAPLAATILGGLSSKRNSQAQLVVREDGVLVHAELREQTNSKVRMAGEDPLLQVVDVMESEARLVQDCDGPVLPSFPDDRTPIERAFAATFALREHALAGDLTQLETLLDPELIAAHPQAARCLLACIDRYGSAALGRRAAPLISDVHESGSTVTLTRSTKLLREGEEDDEDDPFVGHWGDLSLTLHVGEAQAWISALELKARRQPLLRIEPGAPLLTSVDCGGPAEQTDTGAQAGEVDEHAETDEGAAADGDETTDADEHATAGQHQAG